jgi:antitoxin component of MazEF toxin-antitoxin module
LTTTIVFSSKNRIFVEIPPAIIDESAVVPGEPLKVSLVGNDIIFSLTTNYEREGAARAADVVGRARRPQHEDTSVLARRRSAAL